MRRRTLFVSIPAVVLAVSLTSCGLSGGSGSNDKKTVTVYSPRPRAITSLVVADFEKANPDYKVQLLTLGAQEVLDRVRAEAGNPQADVWWGGTGQQFDQGVESKVLTPFPKQIVDRVPAKYRGPKDQWLGEQRLAQLIAYNHDMLSAAQAPKDWDDLVEPRFKGKILIRDVAASGTMRSIFDSMIARTYKANGSPEAGYAFLKKLDANTKNYAANPTDLFLRIQRQEAPITIWNLQDILTQQAKGVPFTPVVPASGSPIILDGIGKVKGAPHSAGADAFAAFLLTKKTQTMLSQKVFQISTVAISDQPAWLTKLHLKEMSIDSKLVNDHDTEWIDYWLQHIKNRG